MIGPRRAIPRSTSTLGAQLRVATLEQGSTPAAVLAVAEAEMTRRMRAEGASPATLAAMRSWERRYDYAIEQLTGPFLAARAGAGLASAALGTITGAVA